MNMSVVIDTRIVSVTPSLAQQWLGNKADYQRKVSTATVKKYTKAMSIGAWQVTPSQTIAISSDGRVVDGQHRLYAVIAYGQPVMMAVCFNVDPGLFNVIDQGRARTLTQVAQMAGLKYSSSWHIAAINSLTWDINAPTKLKAFGTEELLEVCTYFEPFMAVAFPPGTTSGVNCFKFGYVRGAILRAAIAEPERVEDLKEMVRVLSRGWPEPHEKQDHTTTLMLRKELDRFAKGDRVTKTIKNRSMAQWFGSLRMVRYYLDGRVPASPGEMFTLSKRSKTKKHRQPFPIPLDSKPASEPFSAWVEKQDKVNEAEAA